MLIQIGYDIAIRLFDSATIVFLLRAHPSEKATLLTGDRPRIEPGFAVEYFCDSFGNRCGRINAPATTVSLRTAAIVWNSGKPDTYAPEAEALNPGALPASSLIFLLPSRYCEVDSELMEFAWTRFARFTPGWAKVQAVCDFVHRHLRFDYQHAQLLGSGLCQSRP